MKRVTAMMRVVDLAETIAWYERAGFVVVRTNETDGVLDWAMLGFGEGRVMFNVGGVRVAEDRRDVDLYVNTANVDDLWSKLRGHVEVREEPHETFYGMRELIVRDPNGFWVTFAEPVTTA
jgi:uncharacterized glyoxalase superfamily protein PhnB